MKNELENRSAKANDQCSMFQNNTLKVYIYTWADETEGDMIGRKLIKMSVPVREQRNCRVLISSFLSLVFFLPLPPPMLQSNILNSPLLMGARFLLIQQ